MVDNSGAHKFWFLYFLVLLLDNTHFQINIKNNLDKGKETLKRCIKKGRSSKTLKEVSLVTAPSPLTHIQALNCARLMSGCTRSRREPHVVNAPPTPPLRCEEGLLTRGSGQPPWCRPEQPIGSEARPLGTTVKELKPLLGPWKKRAD